MASILVTLAEVREALGTGQRRIDDAGLEAHIDNMDTMLISRRGAHPTNRHSVSFRERRRGLLAMLRVMIEYVAANDEFLPPSKEHLSDLSKIIWSIADVDNNRQNLPVIMSTNGRIMAVNGQIMATGGGS